jgi:hypothetical protein
LRGAIFPKRLLNFIHSKYLVQFFRRSRGVKPSRAPQIPSTNISIAQSSGAFVNAQGSTARAGLTVGAFVFNEVLR